ncbi:hypothetical protein ALC57_07070 [Trachymyrmex cornetzi]|uniref:Uncharacterized protein n=1 Tax=Trachymyrmex cornetzi TaxID=471704 RepID=A0A195E664_9HYME|nr:hypothetical protein ALC57_07070 [Trachymyrmex cornetzi]
MINFPAFVYAAVSVEVLLYPCCSPNINPYRTMYNLVPHPSRMQLNALSRTICVLVHSGTTTFRQVVRETSRQPAQRARLLTERSLRHQEERETVESESTAKGEKTKNDDSEVGGEKNLVDDTRFLRR